MPIPQALSRRKTSQTINRPPLAQLDPLGREIQKVLRLIKPIDAVDDSAAQYEGYCGAASEAYVHIQSVCEVVDRLGDGVLGVRLRVGRVGLEPTSSGL